MILSRNAIGNLVNRYKAVLKKCKIINTFGSLTVAAMLVLGGAGAASAHSGIQWGSTDSTSWEPYDAGRLASYSYLAGANSISGNVSGGEVLIDGDTNAAIIGGYSIDGNATGNTVIITGGTHKVVYGGRSGDTGRIENNHVILAPSSTPITISQTVAGGWSQGNVAGCKLTVAGKSGANIVRDFAYYNFVIPESFKANDTSEVLMEANLFSFGDGSEAKIVSIAGSATKAMYSHCSKELVTY